MAKREHLLQRPGAFLTMAHFPRKYVGRAGLSSSLTCNFPAQSVWGELLFTAAHHLCNRVTALSFLRRGAASPITRTEPHPNHTEPGGALLYRHCTATAPQQHRNRTWLHPCRSTVGASPLYSAPKPSSRTTTTVAVCSTFRYPNLI